MKTPIHFGFHATLFTCLSAVAAAQSTTLFGTTYRVQRFDYKQSIQWTNPVAPNNQQGLIRIEGAWALGNDHFIVSTSHQDQSVPTTYANFVLEIRASRDPQGTVTGFSYVRTVVVNDPVLLGSPFDLRAGGLTVNPTNFGLGAGGNVIAADGGASKALRGYDSTTGALLAYGPNNDGIPTAPPMTDLTDVAIFTEGAQAQWRFYALDEIGLKIYDYTLDGLVQANFSIAGAINPAIIPGDPKGITYLPDALVWPLAFHGDGTLVVSMGDKQPGLQALRRNGTEIGWAPLDPSVFVTSSTSIKPKIEAIVGDPATGQLFLFMEKGSLVDNWLWVLTPDCNGNGLADAADIANGIGFDSNGDGQLDECQAQGVGFCFGDGSQIACPCGNNSTVGSGQGCLNSLGVGAQLTAFGSASIGNDTLRLAGANMPNSSALYVESSAQQSGGAGALFGDGLRCAGGSVIRLRTVSNVGGASHYPATGQASVSAQGLVTTPGTQYYQVWYRNAAAFCTAATFNWSNGLSVTWTP